MTKEKKKFWQRNWFLWLCLIIFPPVGLILLWTCHQQKGKGLKVVLSVVFALWFAVLAAPVSSDAGESTADLPETTGQVERAEPSPSQRLQEAEHTPEAGPSAPPEDRDAEPTQAEPTLAEPTPPPSALPEEQIPPPETREPEETPRPQEQPTGDDTQGTQTQPPAQTGQTDPPPAASSGSGNGDGSGTGDGNSSGDGSGNGENFNTYDDPSQQDTSANYVLNTNTKKFHYPSCSSVKKIAPKNYATTNETRDAVIARGYSSCGRCNP